MSKGCTMRFYRDFSTRSQKRDSVTCIMWYRLSAIYLKKSYVKKSYVDNEYPIYKSLLI